MREYTEHIPVMLDEVVSYMSPKDGELYIDGTFGAGGYSRALLEAANCKIIAIDRDPNVKKIAEDLQKEFPGRIEFCLGKFSDVKQILSKIGISKVDGFVLDVGVSSMQIDQAERGFSFMKDGPLDMRMGEGNVDAGYLVNNTEEKQLANIIYKYSGEKRSRQIASAIVRARQESPITTTKELADIIKTVVRVAKDKIDPCTRTFQAIRIWVNDELTELEEALDSSEIILAEKGRLVVVTFHSLEDSIVKHYINNKSGKIPGASRHVIIANTNNVKPSFAPIAKKAVKPTDKEINFNIRSRSAKLRAAIRLSAGGN